MPRSCCCLIACLTVTAAFTPAPASTTLCGRVSSSTLHGRSSKLSAHLLHGWTPKVDQASGATYFFNTQTGVTQWEPPTAATAQQSFGTQVCYILAPAAGAFNAYTVYNDQEQVLGYHDMIWQNPYIPDAQCVVRVSNGEASLFSLGDTSTALRVPGGQWNFLKKGQAHILADGEQIALDSKRVYLCEGTLPPEGTPQAIFTVYSQQDDRPPQPSGYWQQQGGGYEHQGGYEQQGGYSHVHVHE
jgi:hypothetical protein